MLPRCACAALRSAQPFGWVIPLTLRLLPPLFGTSRSAFLQMPPQQQKPEDKMTSQNFLQIVNEIQDYSSLIERAAKLPVKDQTLIDRYSGYRAKLYASLLLRDTQTQELESLRAKD
jgi:hypothetical protein